MKRYEIFLVTLCIMSGLTCVAHAKTWTVDDDKSHIDFSGTQGNDRFYGGFKHFHIDIHFDPDHPETGKIMATIDMTSAFAGSPERDAALPQADWFNTKQFAQAQFVSTGIQWDRNPTTPTLRQNIGCYKIIGNLTMKGVTKPVIMPFCIAPERDYMHAKGVVTLMRNDFDVGKGQWAAPSFIKYEVRVMIDITAR